MCLDIFTLAGHDRGTSSGMEGPRIVVLEYIYAAFYGQQQGINLKGCLYFVGKGNLKFSLSK